MRRSDDSSDNDDDSEEDDTHDARNYIGTYANLLARLLPKRSTTTRGGLQTPTAKRPQLN